MFFRRSRVAPARVQAAMPMVSRKGGSLQTAEPGSTLALVGVKPRYAL